MTDGDFSLNPSDAARWNAIVSREWSSQLAHPTMRTCNADEIPNTTVHDTETPLTLTIFLPRRPSMLPLAISAMLTGVVAWVGARILAPAYQRGVLPGVVHDRVDAIHQLTVAAAVIAAILLLAATSVSVWLVAFARYRLRRTSCDHVALGTAASTRRIRPPNPATAATGVLLVLIGSAIAWWWTATRLEGAYSLRSEAAASLRDAALGAIAWLAVVLLCIALFTIWAARESRHRLRRAASSEVVD